MKSTSHKIVAGTILLSSLALGACQQLPHPDIYGGVDHRNTRYDHIISQKEFNDCRQEGLNFDRQANEQGRPELFLQSGNQLLSCETSVAGNAHLIRTELRMQTYALGIQNKIQGGDLYGAHEAFLKFSTTFDGHDLIYSDGSSFSDTMHVLFNMSDAQNPVRLAALNARPNVKEEARRVNYWRKN